MLHIKLIARTFGLITVAVMWISTVVIIEHERDSYVGWYLIAASVLVTFFEITWIFNKSACCVREGCCCRIWSAIMYIDNWRKFVFYVALSVPLFLEGMRIALGIVSGFLLLILSILYLVKTFYSQVTVKYEKTETRRIIPSKSPSVRTVTSEISTQTERDSYVIGSHTTTTEVTSETSSGARGGH
ncbi:uncharacterized protein LOC106011085 [Aplysia californica]|uniref:Uncharacterized protein LOC106011085 n=1 Tax=Aplysia californica TaxID=6500 RepID=A0ABM0ZUV0_APLCA|nr:uncharacterized protein LOC106011085 [Aplysia californica]